MPNAWKAGLRWVAASRKLESCLRTSNATEPRSAPCHSARSGMYGRARTLKSTKNIRVVAAIATTTANTSTVHERSWSRPARSSRPGGEARDDTRHGDADEQGGPDHRQGQQVAQLADEEVGPTVDRELEDHVERGPHARQPAQAGVDQGGDADDADGRGSLLDGLQGDLPLARADQPGKGLLDDVDEVVLGVREVAGEVADHDERQGQDRERRRGTRSTSRRPPGSRRSRGCSAPASGSGGPREGTSCGLVRTLPSPGRRGDGIRCRAPSG